MRLIDSNLFSLKIKLHQMRRGEKKNTNFPLHRTLKNFFRSCIHCNHACWRVCNTNKVCYYCVIQKSIFFFQEKKIIHLLNWVEYWWAIWVYDSCFDHYLTFNISHSLKIISRNEQKKKTTENSIATVRTVLSESRDVQKTTTTTTNKQTNKYRSNMWCNLQRVYHLNSLNFRTKICERQKQDALWLMWRALSLSILSIGFFWLGFYLSIFVNKLTSLMLLCTQHVRTSADAAFNMDGIIAVWCFFLLSLKT